MSDMQTASTHSPEAKLTPADKRMLIWFVALAFAFTWGIAALLIAFPEPMEAAFGELSYTNPVFILAVYSPGFAAFGLIWRRFGIGGVGGFLRRLTLWRMPWGWWAFLIIGIPALFYVAALIKGTAGDPFPFDPWYGLLPAFATALLIGPIEEFGWRGVALPLLQRRYVPLVSSLILGVIWATWHIPAFLLSGTPQSSWSFPAYFIAVIALSVIITPMFNAAKGSILIPVLFHFQANGPAWPDAQPWDTVTFGIAAVLVVLFNRKLMLTREGAATDLVFEPRDERMGTGAA
ncbi:MAG TPA: type II CAAX endopeptidase family protein [Actinomycetota bacterium]|nr:type II CAAX endopeptidase family protein [Actinomycetota bacterium]